MGMIRTTRALSVRTVCRNSTFSRVGVKGISSETRDQRRRGLRIASNAPPALSLSKVQNSTNSLPCPLTPRTNTGMARESRTQRRRSLVGWLAAVGSSPRRMGNHRWTEHGPLVWVTRDDIIDWIVNARVLANNPTLPKARASIASMTVPIPFTSLEKTALTPAAEARSDNKGAARPHKQAKVSSVTIRSARFAFT
jgi:hypothetical protein